MLKGIKLDTRWAHNQSLSLINPFKRNRKNPSNQKSEVLGKMSIEEMKQIEYRAFGRLMF